MAQSVRTFCAEKFAIDRCSNAPPVPDTCLGDDPGEQIPADPTTGVAPDSPQCDAFVPSTKPVPPGTAGVFGAPAAQGLPQGPILPTSAAAASQGLPPGVTIPGATGPPGSAPPGSTPPGTQPPGEAPPPGG